MRLPSGISTSNAAILANFPEPGDQQMFVHGFADLGLHGLGINEADDAIGVANRETSGLAMMTASSAQRMASVAPRSMPAGLSQITQSNPMRNSAITGDGGPSQPLGRLLG
jgi:hypothetical protein